MAIQNLQPDYISAYGKETKNFSTETILVKIYPDILKTLEEQKWVLITRLDHMIL